MEPITNQKLCKHHSIGFCKYRDQCRYRHVQEVCVARSCSRLNCFARHPKRCKYFLKKRCKFGDECFYSHDALEADSEQTELLKNEINFLNVSVKELEEDVFKLKRANDMKASELEQADSKYYAMIEEVKELRKINQCLLEDMNLVNEKLKPGVVEQENEKLKETVAILQTVVQIYKQAEIDEEDYRKEQRPGEEPEDENELAQVKTKYKCNYCDFESENYRGVCVHTGIKHKKKEKSNELDLINF